MTFLKKQIAALQDLLFLKILKNLKIYLNLIDWLWQYISYYIQQTELLQNRKTILLYESFTAEQTRKDYLKKTSIFNVNNLKKKYLSSFKKILMISTFFIIRISINSSMLIWMCQSDMNLMSWFITCKMIMTIH